MTDNETYVLIFLIACWVGLSGVATYRILKNKMLRSAHYKLMILLTWVIPFFWALIIILISSKPSKRKVDNRNRNKEAGGGGYAIGG